MAGMKATPGVQPGSLTPEGRKKKMMSLVYPRNYIRKKCTFETTSSMIEVMEAEKLVVHNVTRDSFYNLQEKISHEWQCGNVWLKRKEYGERQKGSYKYL
ncbi:hypothetical protein RUM43_003754 [Polyplax serrata]|uniref:Uncharacterized protein n=1 Tax=Polyplax serrata TaxID=468196 RepID=A0AAN8RXH7_POLSC